MLPVSEGMQGGVVEIVARPNRSLDLRRLCLALVALAVAVFAVAGFSYVHGNLWAPLFALLDVVVVGACLVLVWMRGGDLDRIRLDPEALVVEYRRGARSHCWRYPSAWVRVWLEPGGSAHALPRVCIGSHGRCTVVGDFLVEEERMRLLRLLRQRLQDVRGARAPAAMESQARGQMA